MNGISVLVDLLSIGWIVTWLGAIWIKTNRVELFLTGLLFLGLAFLLSQVDTPIKKKKRRRIKK
jgi:hypothetical protein